MLNAVQWTVKGSCIVSEICTLRELHTGKYIFEAFAYALFDAISFVGTKKIRRRELEKITLYVNIIFRIKIHL